jgi:DTW domain-containing protein YfiP
LVVPDGSWRQARKAVGREPGLQGLRRVKLPAGGPPSEYRLRVEPNEHSVCTFEAIARALGVLEGRETQDQLEALFRVSVGRTLWSRGMIKAEEVPGGIPPGAAT